MSTALSTLQDLASGKLKPATLKIINGFAETAGVSQGIATGVLSTLADAEALRIGLRLQEKRGILPPGTVRAAESVARRGKATAEVLGLTASLADSMEGALSRRSVARQMAKVLAMSDEATALLRAVEEAKATVAEEAQP